MHQLFVLSRLVPVSRLPLLVVLGLSSFALFATPIKRLTFEQAIHIAQKNDLWLLGNRQQQNALNALSRAANTLPDPVVSIGLANVAANSLTFNQEPMTQLKLGINQKFPRGDSLALKQQQLASLAAQYPYQRDDRRAQVALTVGKLWLDGYLAQQSIRLIKQDYGLFQQLTDIAQAKYATTVGKNLQQDIIRAELVVSRLNDRIATLQQHQLVIEQQLMQWLWVYTGNKNRIDEQLLTGFSLSVQLPNIAIEQPTLVKTSTNLSLTQLAQHFMQHPSVKAIQQKILAATKTIALTKQSYKPAWSVTAGYGYRDSAPMGTNRSDLLSIGVSFDVPLFTNNKQDKQVIAAVSTQQSIETQKLLRLRQLMAQFNSSATELQQLDQRAKRYQQQILPQSNLQAEATLNAYTNDDGDFAEVVRARIDELNSKIDALAISVAQQKARLTLNYTTYQSSLTKP